MNELEANSARLIAKIDELTSAVDGVVRAAVKAKERGQTIQPTGVRLAVQFLATVVRQNRNDQNDSSAP